MIAGNTYIGYTPVSPRREEEDMGGKPTHIDYAGVGAPAVDRGVRSFAL